MPLPTLFQLPVLAVLLFVLAACAGTRSPDVGSPFPTPATRPAVSSASPSARVGAPASTSTEPPVGIGAPAGSAPATCPDAEGPIGGPIVFGMDNTLMAIGADGGTPHVLIHVDPARFVYEPAWSPDGRTLAYTLSRPADDPDLSWLPVGVICGLDRATGKGRLLARSSAPLDGLNEPAWSPDGTTLLVTLHQPRLNEQRQYTGDKMTLARYDLAAGTMQPLAEHAMSGTLSRDGTQLAFLSIDPQDLRATLMVGAANGQVNPLPPSNPPLFLMLMPRWSPDGTQLAFTASGGGLRSSRPPQRSWLERVLGVEVALAHGAPTDIWISDDSGSPRRLTTLALDDARVAWSPDGKQLAITNGLGGITLLELAGNTQRQLTDQGNYGGIAWADW